MSSIVSFDIYGAHINKNPTDGQLIRWSHIGVVGSAIFIASFASILHAAGVDLNWLLYMMGIVIW